MDFSLIASLVAALGVSDTDAVMNFLKDNDAVTLHEDDEAFTRELVEFALVYHREVMNAKAIVLDPASLEAGEIAALKALVDALNDAPFEDAQELQSTTYRAGKGEELNLRAWFGLLYTILTGNSAGPRLGTLLQMLGRETAQEKIRTFLAPQG